MAKATNRSFVISSKMASAAAGWCILVSTLGRKVRVRVRVRVRVSALSQSLGTKSSGESESR